MTWLYSIIFTGLMFSSQGSEVPSVEPTIQDRPQVAEAAMADESERFSQTYPLNANGRVCLSNINGSVVVEAWDRNEVKVEYTKTADTKERLGDVDVRIDAKPDFIEIEADITWKRDTGGWRTNNKLQVDFHLTVPRGAVLNEIETVNGSVTISKFTNFAKVSAVNGTVTATNLRGTANLSTVNGEINADFDKLEPGTKVTLSTVNGAAKVVIPSDSNATLKVDSLNGNITTDFGLPVRKGKYVGRDLYGRIGSGEVPVKLSSVNGPLTISRQNDGKTLSPATDLLQQKKDEDWDDEEGAVIIDNNKLNKEVSKSLKTTHKEIVKMRPEIAKVTAESMAAAAEAVKAAKALDPQELEVRLREARERERDFAGHIANIGFITGAPRIEKKSGSISVKGVPKVTIDAKGCAVSVQGWDKNEVQYRVVQFSGPRPGAPLEVTESHGDSSVNINVKAPSFGGRLFDRRSTVRIEVFVPKRTNLKIDSDGSVRLEGVSGDLEVSGADESINVRDVDGTMRVSSSDGRIRVVGFSGDIVAESANGSINLEGDFQNLQARAEGAPILLTVPEGSGADLEATCPDVRGEGISLTRISTDESLSRYRIGSGGPKFTVSTDGEIRVRSTGSLRASL